MWTVEIGCRNGPLDCREYVCLRDAVARITENGMILKGVFCLGKCVIIRLVTWNNRAFVFRAT